MMQPTAQEFATPGSDYHTNLRLHRATAQKQYSQTIYGREVTYVLGPSKTPSPMDGGRDGVLWRDLGVFEAAVAAKD